MNKLYLSFIVGALWNLQSFAQEETISLYFEPDASALTATHVQQLNRILNGGYLIVKIEAYCDSTGSVAHNEGLGRRRMQVVADHLHVEEAGKIVSYGERKSAVKNQPLEHFRRVDVTYSEPVPPEMPDPEPVDPEMLPSPDGPPLLENALEAFIADKDADEILIQLSILFYNRSGQYLPESEPELWHLLEFMKENPDVSVHVRGHICCVPGLDWDDISEARARTVAYYLTDRGISRERVTYKGYGSSRPYRDPEITEVDRKLNRRVDVVFTRN